MNRKLKLTTVAAGLLSAVALGAFAYVHAATAEEAELQRKALLRRTLVQQSTVWQPDLSSTKWKEISKDLGVWVDKSETFGLRGRLYANIDGVWYPVAVDGLADLGGVLPAR
jgi:hypothetical protein